MAEIFFLRDCLCSQNEARFAQMQAEQDEKERQLELALARLVCFPKCFADLTVFCSLFRCFRSSGARGGDHSDAERPRG